MVSFRELGLSNLLVETQIVNWLPMLGIFILVSLIVFAFQMIHRLPEIKEVLKLAGTAPRGAMVSPGIRMVDMGRELGRQWTDWDPENDAQIEFVRPTNRHNFQCRYFGPLDMEVAGDQVLIYDMLFWNVYGVENEQQPFQTVITIKPPEIRLPPFILRPHNVFKTTTSESIKTNTALDMQFDVESMTPHRVKALFQSELGTGALVPFLMDHNWTVEWTGDRLIVYELNRLIDPKLIAEVALEASEFFELLKSGPEVIERSMENFIKQAVLQS